MRAIPLFFLAIFITFSPLRAALDIKITRGHLNPIPLAIPDFVADSDHSAQISINMRDVILADLKSSGLFNIIPKSAHIQNIQDIQKAVRYNEWRLIKADNLVSVSLSKNNGEFRIELRVIDTVREQQIEGKAYTGKVEDWRRMAHKISDAIYQRLIGDPGYFDTQIAYVARTEKGNKRTERLAIMDQDGENHAYLTDGKNLVMSPRFSPDLRYLAFLNFTNNKPRVYIYNRDTKKTRLVGSFSGMTFAPRFSHDGNKMVMSFAHNGNTSLFEINLKTLKIKRLTFNPVIDTSPCYSPDDEQIVFTSDRSGRTQLYVMPAKGGSARRISFGSGGYRTPVWSPRGDLIAFTKIWRGEFYIGIMRTDGSGERLITKGFLVEGPSWAPNGRVILYTRDDRKGSPQLYSIDITGFNERLVKTPGSALQSSWSQKR